MPVSTPESWSTVATGGAGLGGPVIVHEVTFGQLGIAVWPRRSLMVAEDVSGL